MNKRLLVVGVILGVVGLVVPQLFADIPSYMDWVKNVVGDLYTLVGKVGIGTSSPTEKLEVVGNAKVSANLMVDTPTLVVDAATNRVGIGTATPTAKLDVTGTAQMTGFRMPTGAQATYVLTADAAGIGTWQPASGGLGGSGTAGTLAKFTGTTALGDSVITESALGNVGIGTANPAAKLDVQGADGTGVIVARRTGGLQIAALASETDGSGQLVLRRFDGTARVNFSGKDGAVHFIQEGNVGIGTTAPGAKLHVDGSGITRLLVSSSDNNPEVVLRPGGAGVDPLLVFQNPAGVEVSRVQGNLGVLLLDGPQVGFRIGGVDKVWIDGSGNVGIGTTTPSSKLHVLGTTTIGEPVATYGDLVFNYPDSSGEIGKISFKSGGVEQAKIGFNVASGGGGELFFGTGAPSSTRVVIDKNGNVGIGTAAPGAKLHVDGSGITRLLVSSSDNNPEVVLRPGGTGADPLLVFQSAAGAEVSRVQGNAGVLLLNGPQIGFRIGGVDKVRIDGSGNVGIGTTTPAQKLDVIGTIQMTGFKLPAGASAGYVLTADAAGVGTWQSVGGGGGGGWTDAGTVVHLTTATDNVGIGTTSPVAKLDVAGGIAIAGSAQRGIWNSKVPLANSAVTVDAGGLVGGSFPSLSIGPDGLAVIAYLDYTNVFDADLKVAKCGNPACTAGNTVTTVDSVGNVGRYTSVAIGADGLPVISYYDSTNNDLKVAKCGNPACNAGNTVTTVDATGTAGTYTSITLGLDTFPVISYSANISELRVAKCGNPTCTAGNTVTVVDNSSAIVDYTSIAIGLDGLPVISYKGGAATLRVAKCGNAACTAGNTITTVDSASPPNGSCGSYNSLTIGPDGLPVISYLYTADFNVNWNLKVAKCGNAACSASNTLTIVDSGVVGFNTSITLGTDGLPIVAYYDSANFDLKVAKCGNAFCSAGNTVIVVDAGGDVGSGTSIAIGPDGLPIMAYRDDTNDDLKVARCGSDRCLPYWTRR